MQIAAEVMSFFNFFLSFFFYFIFFLNLVLILQRDLCSGHRNLCVQRQGCLASVVAQKPMPQLSNKLCCFLFPFLPF